ncbi:MAG: hypothetical protein AAF919_00350 [Pseudomonadota bacterium]
MRYYLDCIDPLVYLDVSDLLEQTFAARDVRGIADLNEVISEGTDTQSVVIISARPVAELRAHTAIAILPDDSTGYVLLNGHEEHPAHEGANWTTIAVPFDGATLIDAIRRVMPQNS